MYTQEIVCPSCGNLAIVNVPDSGKATTPCKHCGKKIAIAVDEHGKVTSIYQDPCFVATACYGTPYAPEVEALRRFRDLYLMPYRAGRGIVQLYYRYSPHVAIYLERHRTLATLIRTLALDPLSRFVAADNNHAGRGT
jgi:hypothetical protein